MSLKRVEELELPLAIVSGTFGFLGLSIETSIVYVLYKKARFSRSVKAFLFANVIGRIYQHLYAFYEAFCNIEQNCFLFEREVASAWLSNVILSTIFKSIQFAMVFIDFGLSLNRVFAVFFDGRLYQMADKMSLYHISISLLCPICLYGSLIQQTFFSSFSNLFLAFENLQMFMMQPMIAADLWVLLQVRMMNHKLNRQNSADTRLAILALASHLMNISHYLNYQLTSIFDLNKTVFVTFLADNLVAKIAAIIEGLVILGFSWPREEDGKTIKVQEKETTTSARERRRTKPEF
ncbi:unnamed protein product, partial [Mesorhabditis belari]|uniref:Uncharacterized protein n=1 Tax=Mesorhabditis belari TaxID=2138241 RepID=A0AAF3FP03_9BILA